MRRIKEDEALRRILEGTVSETGFAFFRELVRNLSRTLYTRAAWVTRYIPKKRRLSSLAFWRDGSFVDSYDYNIAGTPCERAIDDGCLVHYPDRATDLFPLDEDMKKLGIVSYMAVPMLDTDGAMMGHLAVMDDQPMPEEPLLVPLFELFAARAAAELRRLIADNKIRVLTDEAEYLRDMARDGSDGGEILGSCRSMRSLFQAITQVAETDVTVLILGETGTGKELVARAIHRASDRREKPLIRVNCAAIPATLTESEFFGHEKGAFTGATARREGRFALADGGSIFLDEVGELPVELQAKLLRVLQEGEFEPLGSTRTHKVDVRVIAATNRDLDAAARLGEFRKDLFYRLNVFPVQIPPLRERGGDIGLLADAFARRFADRTGRCVQVLDPADMKFLAGYSWPGNVRELQNVVERAIILSTGDHIDLGRAMPDAAGSQTAQIPEVNERSGASPRILSADEMHRLERDNMVRALRAARWKIAGSAGAAKLLGIAPSTLTSRMKSLGIRRRPISS
jgi:transcriptional regulator with GAF, ATPase, and Fis domain